VAFECENVELLSFLPQDSLGKSTGTDLWGWHDSTTGREYMLIGGASTAFVDVTDPLNPKYLGVLPPHGGITRHAAQSVKVYQHYALIGYEGVNHGIQIFDLSQAAHRQEPAGRVPGDGALRRGRQHAHHHHEPGDRLRLRQ
jgi:choice-of-anchor B domain-containing protein